MKKFALIAAAALMGASAFADSYTITFKDNGSVSDGSVVLKPETAVADFVTEGADYVQGVAIGTNGTTTRAYRSKTGYGIKLGASKDPGNLVLKLATKGQVAADSIVVEACAWWNGSTSAVDVPTATLNGAALNVAADTLWANYKIEYTEPQAIDTLYLSGTAYGESDKGRYYVKSITVYYTPSGNISFDTDLCYSPSQKYPGTDHQVVIGADLLTKKPNADGAMKAAINDQWINWVVYNNPTATVADGTSEVSVSNVYTSYNAFTGDTIENASDMKMLCCSDQKTWIGFPKVEAQKTIDLYIKDTKKISFILTGAGSSETENAADIIISEYDAPYAEQYTTPAMPGKSQKAAFYDPAAYNNKCVASYKFVKELDPQKYYKITLKAHNEATGTVSFVSAFLNDTIDAVASTAFASADPSFAYWQVVLGPDMITDAKTRGGEVVNKHAIDDTTFPWISYTRSDGVPFDDGTAEVQGAARYTTLSPVTGDSCTAYAIQGKNGLWNDPVVDQDKTLHFNVQGTKKFRIYATGSASSASSLVVKVNPISVFDAPQELVSPEIAGKSNKADGSQSHPEVVSADLNADLMYHIAVSTNNSSLAILGVNLYDNNTEANQESGKGTLNLAVEKAAENDVIDLGGDSWTLKGIAATDMKNLTIQNGAVVADSLGQLTTKNSIVLDGVKIESILAPVAMAGKETLTAADTTALYTEIVIGYDTVIASIDTTYLEDQTMKVDTTYAYNEVKGMKYENASNKVFEAQLIAIRNSTIKTASSFVSGGNAPWALRTLEVTNSVLETSANSGKAFLNWEEGASQIKDIVITESTLYADSVNTTQRFHRYSSQVDPWRVWGYDGENKNAPGMNTWTLTNNTFVNLCGNKEFSNNIKNTAATTFLFKGNVFANCWRLQKLGSNVTREFTAEDNVICGGVNTVDGTDASKWATEDANMGVTVDHLSPCPYSWTAALQYGDPDLLVDFIDLTESTYEFNTEVSGSWYFQGCFVNADSVVVAEDAALPIYNVEDLVEPTEEGEEATIPTPIFTVTAAMMNVEGNKVTVNIPAMAESLIPAGTYAVIVPEGSFTVYGQADNFEHGVANLDNGIEFTIDVPTAIEELSNETNAKVMYNVAGQRVNSAKGFVIVNGKVEMAK